MMTASSLRQCAARRPLLPLLLAGLAGLPVSAQHVLDAGEDGRLLDVRLDQPSLSPPAVDGARRVRFPAEPSWLGMVPGSLPAPSSPMRWRGAGADMGGRPPAHLMQNIPLEFDLELFLRPSLSDPDGDGLFDFFDGFFHFDSYTISPITLNNDLPAYIDVATRDSGDSLLFWSDTSTWNSPTLALTNAWSTSVTLISAIALDVPALAVSLQPTYDALVNAGPTEKRITTPFGITAGIPELIPGWQLSFNPSLPVRFGVTIGEGKDVTLNQANVVIEELTVNGGLTGRSDLLVRGDVVANGTYANAGGTIEGDFAVTGLAIGGNSNLNVLGDLLITGETRVLRGTIEGNVTNDGTLGIIDLILLNPLGENDHSIVLNGKLYSPDALVNNGHLVWNNGRKAGNPDVVNNGDMQWVSGSLRDSHLTNTQSGTVSIDADAGENVTIDHFGTLDNYGTILHAGEGPLRLLHAGTNHSSNYAAKFENHSGALYDLRSDADILSVLSGGSGSDPGTSFTNDGTFRKSAGAGESVIGVRTFTNNGLVDLQSGSLVFTAGTFVNNGGTISVGSGTLVFDRQPSATGDFAVSGTGLLTLKQGLSFTSRASLQIDPGIVTVMEGGTLASADIHGDMTIRSGTLSGVNVAPGSQLTLHGDSIWNLAQLQTSTNDGSIIHTGNGTLRLLHAGTNHSSNYAAKFENHSGALYDLRSDADILSVLSGGSGSDPGTSFTNDGTFRKSAGAGESVIGVRTFTNNGLVEAACGDLGFNSSYFTNDGGELRTVADSTIRIVNTATFLGSSTIAGNVVAESFLNFEELTLDKATLSVASLNIQSTDVLRGSGAIKGNLSNSGTLDPGLDIGTLSIYGSYTQASAGDLVLKIAAGKWDRLDVRGTATLSGDLVLHAFPNAGLSTGDFLTLIDADSLLGTFDRIVIQKGSNWLDFEAVYSDTGFGVRAIPAPASAFLFIGAAAVTRRR